jgi:hypothetical protein
MFARQVVINCIKIEGFEIFVATFSALDPWFLTDDRHPLVRTSDSIAGTTAGTLPANRINILPASKEFSVYFNFLARGE